MGNKKREQIEGIYREKEEKRDRERKGMKMGRKREEKEGIHRKRE